MRIQAEKKEIKKNERYVEINKDIIDLYELWYTKYTSILRFLGIISIGIFTISSNFVFSYVLDHPEDIGTLDKALLLISLFIIFSAGILAFLWISAMYRWFISIIERTIYLSEDDYNHAFGKRKDMRKRGSKKSIEFWDKANFLAGTVSGLLLLTGLILYWYAVSRFL